MSETSKKLFEICWKLGISQGSIVASMAQRRRDLKKVSSKTMEYLKAL